MAKKISNQPDAKQAENLRKLIDKVLQPLREAYGKPIRINSGFRSAALNAAVGGVKTSHHVKGQAADITGGNATENRILFELAQSLNLPFCQLIDEKGFRWIHISYDENNVKRQVLHL
nr:MAG TPA: peptidase [Caudoviricetes sp.]